MAKFYSDLFGWKFSKQDMPGMDYWMIETTGQGPDHLAGGMFLRQGEMDKPRFFVAVEDIDSHTEKLKEAGGTVVYEKQEVPGFGWSVLAADPDNNIIGLFQPTTPPRPRKAPAKKKAAPAKKKSKKGKR